MTKPELDNTGAHIPGVVYTRPKDKSRDFMRAFDVLPANVRQAISAATYDFDPETAVRLMRQGWTAAEIVASLVETDREYRRLADKDKGLQP